MIRLVGACMWLDETLSRNSAQLSAYASRLGRVCISDAAPALPHGLQPLLLSCRRLSAAWFLLESPAWAAATCS